MAFKVAVVIMAPDGAPKKHRASIKTPKLELIAVVGDLDDFDKIVNECTDLVRKQGVQALFLCPYFNQAEVAKLAEAVGEEIPIAVARSDVPGTMKMGAILTREGWFSESL